MTKCIVLGQQTTNKRRSIEFVKGINADFSTSFTDMDPQDYEYVELVSRNYNQRDASESLDLMFAYDDPDDRGDGVLFIGRWNDGILG